MKALTNPSWGVLAVHLTIASYMATAFMVAAIYAWGLLKGRRDAYHKSALAIAMVLGTITALAQPISGDVSARLVAQTQPVKLAAMESQFKTEAGAPLRIGGIPDSGDRNGALLHGDTLRPQLPGDPRHQRHHQGLDTVPRDHWPAVPVVHIAFQLMVGSGLGILFFALVYWFLRWRKREHGALEPARPGAERRAWRDSARGGLDRHRSGPPALDHLQCDDAPPTP